MGRLVDTSMLMCWTRQPVQYDSAYLWYPRIPDCTLTALHLLRLAAPFLHHPQVAAQASVFLGTARSTMTETVVYERLAQVRVRRGEKARW
jgi:hypothetical protein